MKLKKDWSLAHFLYYMTWLSIIGFVVQFITISTPYLFGDGSSIMVLSVYDPPVEIQTESLGIQEKVYLNNKTIFGLGKKISVFPVLLTEDESLHTGMWMVMLIRFLRYLLLGIFFYCFNRILKTVIQNDPFSNKNSTRLYIMGVSLMVLPIIRIIHSSVLAGYLSKSISENAYQFSASFNNSEGSIMFGLTIVLLGYVFKEGTRIYEEQKLTV